MKIYARFSYSLYPGRCINWIEENKSIVHAEWIKKDSRDKEKFCLFINQKWGFELKKSFIDFQLYMQDQEQVGVTHSMISPIPQLFLYDFPIEISTEMSRVYNRALSQLDSKDTGKAVSCWYSTIDTPRQGRRNFD